MIDYLEDLLEEETAVELTGALLAPVGRRRIPVPEEERDPVREGQGEEDRAVEEHPLSPVRQEGEGRAGRSFWAEGGEAPRLGAEVLLTALARASLAAGQIRRGGHPLAAAEPGEFPRQEGLDLEAIDRAVRRDARRYDGGFPLY